MTSSAKPARATLLALASAARAFAELAEAVARDAASADGDEMLALAGAAALAGVSERTLRDARRCGDLVMFGGQRSRTIRRADLLAWIESRKAPIVTDVVADDDDIEARIHRREKGRRTA